MVHHRAAFFAFSDKCIHGEQKYRALQHKSMQRMDSAPKIAQLFSQRGLLDVQV
jgi:hypothetical protein